MPPTVRQEISQRSVGYDINGPRWIALVAPSTYNAGVESVNFIKELKLLCKSFEDCLILPLDRLDGRPAELCGEI
jgi:hypothetical protein